MPENLSAESVQAEVFSDVMLPGVPPLAQKLLPLEKVRDLYRRVRQAGFGLENLLSEMKVDLQVGADDLDRIPVNGPVVAVANHPFGMLDGAVLAALLTRVRTDVKVLTNFLLRGVPELAQHCIFVDPFQTREGMNLNRRALRAALAWLRRGGMLAVFPSGEVSHLQLPQGEIADPKWNDAAARLIRMTGASALPVYFCGRNSVSFHLLGMIHPRLRTAFLLQEFLQQQGRAVEVRIGSEITPESMATLRDSRETIEYLRWRTYLLARRKRSEAAWPEIIRSKITESIQTRVASAEQSELLSDEIGRLPGDRLLAESGELAAYFARAMEIPLLMRELGRLRELTFRLAGEGTGKARDLDRFDDYYLQILLWNRGKQELVGAYRAGNTAEIIRQHGISGLYSNTLFRYDAQLFEKIGPSLELGRSFVRAECQRQFAPLLLLWKGIAHLVAKHSRTPVLFGAVSISNDYSKTSREMIYRFFETHSENNELAKLIVPRRPFRPAMLRPWDCRAMCRALHDIDSLSQPVIDVEPDKKGLPILLRQYAKVGGKLLAFNVDRKFGNVLDGLMMVDLRKTEPALLERFMGRECAMRFRQAQGM